MRWVCYIEVQGLYAAVARRMGLAPADRPVAVLRDGRVFDGCREAFAAGLALGAPARQVLRDVPQAAQIDLANVDCAAAARTWWDGCLAHTPYVEPGEPHQVFLALPSPQAELTQAVRAEAAALVEQAAAHGFVAFAGVAHSKLVARAAALSCKDGWLLRRPGRLGANSPATMAFVPPGDEERFLAPLPVAFLPASREVERRLARLGLKHIGEVARIPEGEWQRQLGPLGRQLAQWSRGVDAEPVKAAYPPRSLQRRVEFAQEVRDRDHVERVAARAAALLSKQLAGRGEGCQQANVTVERSDGPPLLASRTLAKLQQSAYPLQQAVQGLLAEALAQAADGAREGPGVAAGWDAGVPVTALAVELGLIGPMPLQQMDLWGDTVAATERDERLERALALLHERFPVRMVGLGPRQDISFREQMLQFTDPYRWVPEGAGPS